MRAPMPFRRRKRVPDVLVRIAETPADIQRCRDLVSSVYAVAYGVMMTDGTADPDGGIEKFPDRWLMGEADGQLVACAGLYTRETYVERYGGVTDVDIARALAFAGVRDGSRRRRYEYTKIVVAPGWGRLGIGRQFIAASHSRDFLGRDSGELPPLLLVCAKLSVFRLWDAVGIHTRHLRPFPEYRNHDRYRTPEDPMESRLVIPERDVEARWYEASLPLTLTIDESGDTMPAHIAYGTYEHRSAPRRPLSTVDIRVSAVDMVVHWRRCALTSDFLAGFLAPNAEEADAARSRLSMIIDELLENAVKFCADAAAPVEVSVRNFGEVIEVEASNTCDSQRARDLAASVRRVLDNDPELLFLEQVEKTATEDPNASRLGFITLCLHGGARLGARIVEADRDGLYNVSVQVLLPAQEVAAK